MSVNCGVPIGDRAMILSGSGAQETDIPVLVPITLAKTRGIGERQEPVDPGVAQAVALRSKVRTARFRERGENQSDAIDTLPTRTVQPVADPDEAAGGIKKSFR